MTASLTLPEHIVLEKSFPEGDPGKFSRIMYHLSMAAKLIARDLRKAGLNEFLGSTGLLNVQGEEVQKLDERANQILLEAFETQDLVSTLISEEEENPYFIKKAESVGEYAVYFDPLDGSSNIDVNAPLGTIFSVHYLPNSGAPISEKDLWKKGSEQVAAGYFLYGSSVILVYTCGSGVHQFVLDPEVGEFFLTASHLRTPNRGKIYSVNEGNRQKWSSGAQKYLDYLQEVNSKQGRPYSGRYSGCFVADVHRVLVKGGIYLYPGEQDKPEGKLRLLYEAAPLTFIMEQAGGLGSTGSTRVNQVSPQALHQRVPLFIGSKDDVIQAEEFL